MTDWSLCEQQCSQSSVEYSCDFLQYIPVGSATISHIRDSNRRHVFILHDFKKSCLRRDGGIWQGEATKTKTDNDL